MTLTVGSMFSGIDGLALGIERALDARTVWQAETDPAASKVLAARWPDVPNLGDVTAVDWSGLAPGRPDLRRLPVPAVLARRQTARGRR